MSTVSTLEVRLNDLLVGYLTHYPDEKTVLVIDESYIELALRALHTMYGLDAVEETV